MARIELTPANLIVHVEGMDRIWALKSQLQIPLQHVVDAAVDDQIARAWWHGLRMPGTSIPGVITAGTFYKDGQRVFWDVHHPERTLVITLADEQYARLIIEVDDPSAGAEAINRAVGASGRLPSGPDQISDS